MHACMHALCWRSLPRGHPSPAMLLVKPTPAFLPSMPMAKHAHPTGTPRGCKRLFLSVSPMIQEVQKSVAGAGMEVPLFRFGLLLFLVSTFFVSHFFPLKTSQNQGDQIGIPRTNSTHSLGSNPWVSALPRWAGDFLPLPQPGARQRVPSGRLQPRLKTEGSPWRPSHVQTYKYQGMPPKQLLESV